MEPSMKKHLLFCSVPAHGHVNPTLPLVEELVCRGHRVTYATNSSFTTDIESTGATLLPTGEELPPRPSIIEFNPEVIAQLMERMVGQARSSIPPMVEHAQQDPPDAVCYDMMTFTGSVLAEKLGVPGIGLMPSFASNEQFSLRDEIMPKEFDPDQPELRRAFQQMQDFAAEHGVSPIPHPMAAAPAALNIVFLPKEFQLAGETFDDRFRFVGPSLGSRASDQSWRPRDESAPLLFISLGTAFNNRPDFFRMCLDAFGDGSWHVAMAVGDQIDPAELGALPANVEVRPYFPQPTVLRHAEVFLSHAGMNSTMESLYSGVPLVTVPQMPEQEANARRVEELGLGRRLVTSEVTSPMLRSAVDEVAADHQIRDSLAEMTRIVRNAGGPVAATDAIEAHLTA
jgi:MGT family glycosyltransferase